MGIQEIVSMLYGHYIRTIHIFNDHHLLRSHYSMTRGEIEMKTYKWFGYFAIGVAALSLMAVGNLGLTLLKRKGAIEL